jgi:hypothetical protein
VLTIRPDRVAVYSFAFVPWIRAHMKHLPAESLPEPRVKLELLALAIEAFSAAGYRHIGMDHFALPDDELARAIDRHSLHRNFMGYTVQSAQDMVALGVSGIGDLQGTFVQNVKKLTEYYAALEHGRFPVERGYALDADDVIRRHVITELMCNAHLDVARVERMFGIRFRDYFGAEVGELTGTDSPRQTASSAHDDALEVTPVGRCSSATSAWCSIATCARERRRRSRCSAARYERRASRRDRGWRRNRSVTGVALKQAAAAERRPVHITLLEAGPAGGHAQTVHEDGYVIEKGPNGFLNREPATLDLVKALGLESRLIPARPEARRRYILREGRLCRAPESPQTLIATRALSLAGKLACLESRSPAAPSRAWTKLFTTSRAAALAVRRRKCSWTRPCPGSQRATAARSRWPHSFRPWSRWNASTGVSCAPCSLDGGAAARRSALMSFDRGLATLIGAHRPAGRCRPHRHEGHHLERDGSVWRVRTDRGDSLAADHVVLAVPSRIASTLVARFDTALAASLAAIPFSGLAVVALAYRASDVPRPLDGYGYLVTRQENLPTLGVVWESSLFPGRSPEGMVLLRAFLGGARRPTSRRRAHLRPSRLRAPTSSASWASRLRRPVRGRSPGRTPSRSTRWATWIGSPPFDTAWNGTPGSPSAARPTTGRRSITPSRPAPGPGAISPHTLRRG